MSSTWTLWTLPAQPSPRTDVTSSVFVTLWAFTSVIFSVLFHLKLSGSTPVWPEFKNIRGSAILLAVWYTATAADRWLHYEQRVLPYGFILFEPILNIIRVISTIWFLWGTYKVVWNELERRFETKKSQGAWWLAAKVAIFIVGLVSFYHVVLRIAMALVWLQFLSLNIIADVATKCNDFELAMTAFFTVFSILTLLAAVATIFFCAREREGSWAKTRVYLVLAAIMFFGRSLAECIIVSMIHCGVLLRHNAQLSYDVAYGLLTSLYLLFMYLQTCQLSSKLDTGTSDAENVKSDVRAWILYRLSNVTGHHKLVAPPFSSILDEASDELAAILEHGPLSLDSKLTPEKKRKVAASYIKQLRSQFSRLAPQPRTMPVESQSPSNRGKTTPSGRQSAPISSSMYERLRSTSDPHIRKPVSTPNMRGNNRFGPRGLHEATSAASGLWQPNIAPIEERQPQAPTYPSSVPFQPGPARPTDPNAPSFSVRAQAAGLGSEQRAFSGPVIVGQQQRRRFGPQSDNPIRDAGLAQFQAQPPQAYPPDSYAPRPHAYPPQSLSSQPGSPLPQPPSLVPLPAQDYIPQYRPQVVDSQTTIVGAYSDTTAAPAEPNYPPAQPQQRRRFEPGRTASPLIPSPAPPNIVPPAEPSPQTYNRQEFPSASSPGQATQAGPSQQPRMFQFQMPGPAYPETVTDSDVASSRSPVNFDFTLSDLGRESSPR